MKDQVFDLDLIKKTYQNLSEKVSAARTVLNKPLTLSEKILYSHLWDGHAKTAFSRGSDYVDFAPDRIACQDATAQMALLQFMQAGKSKVAVPTTVHCDHLIQAKIGADEDLQNALNSSNEVFNFLESVSNKYGIGFWKPGAGIIHQVVLENYAFPGGMMIGTDSHTVNAGGLGMVAIGVGGADAVDVMAGMPWELKFPKLIGVHLKGKLNGWASAKDVILKVAGILTVKGGTGAIVEYFGEGARSLSCTGKGTICNMGAEIGATTSTFGYDESMRRYLAATGRQDVVDLADQISDHLTGDDEVYANPEQYFDEVIEIDLSKLEPHLNGPFSPDIDTPVSEMKERLKSEDWPQDIEWGLIGSCTNSSYEDLSRAASVAKQAIDKGLKIKAQFGINPGSEQVRYTTDRDGILKIFEDVDATIFTNACGPCIGQWKRDDIEEGQTNTIVSSYNRNFPARNDGNKETLSFIGSPETVIGLALGGTLEFDFLNDTLINEDGEEVKLSPPSAEELPSEGFESTLEGFVQPKENSEVEVVINPDSERLQALTPFDSFDASNYLDMTVIMKAVGKCTTDHISPAGKWLRFRGHLENISQNLFIGVNNAFTEDSGTGVNTLNNEIMTLPDLAKTYHENNINWIAIGDENYGEGSSREHAAMEPRFRGCRVVLVKSFARIHEANLKKQGILPLTFEDKTDYEKIEQNDKLTIKNLENLSPGSKVTVSIQKEDGSKVDIDTSHSLSEEQISWFESGSALNYIKSN